MNILNKIKKGLTVTLASVILISSVPNVVQAASFKDVPSSHWAYKYVEKSSELGYFKGNEQGQFLPDGKAGTLNFDATIALLGRFTNPSVSEKMMAKNAFNTSLKGMGVVDWARDDMAVALFKNIISEDEMKRVYDAGRGNRAITKVATSRYLVRAMGLTDEAENKNMVSLTYRDALEMSTLEMKYVSVLIDTEVLDAKGDGTGLFNPNSSLTRSVMAKMMVTANDYLEKNPSENGAEKPIEADKEEIVKINSTILRPMQVLGAKNFIIIDDGEGKEDAYEILDSTLITLDGRSVSKSELKEGQEIEITIKKGTREIITLDARSQEKDIIGHIKSINTVKDEVTIDYSVDKKILSKTFSVDKDADIYIDGNKARLKDLSEGDKLDAKIKNNSIYEIEAEAKVKRVEGIITNLTAVKDSRKKEYNITIENIEKDKEKKTYTFLIDEDTIIYRNDRRVSDPAELKLKDHAYIRAEFDKVLEMDANVVKRQVKGVIVGMTSRLHEKLELTVFNRDTKKEERFIIGQTPYIRVDGLITNTFDLKVGYYVDLQVEGDQVIEIDADSKSAEVAIMGTVSYISTRNMEMIITIENLDQDIEKYGQEITVYFNLDVVVADNKLNPLKIDQVRRGDRVNIIGIYDGNALIANTIHIR